MKIGMAKISQKLRIKWNFELTKDLYSGNKILIQIINIKVFLYREKTLKQKYFQKFQ